MRSFFLAINYQSPPVSEFCWSSLAILWMRMLLKVMRNVTVSCLMISSELTRLFWERRKVTWCEPRDTRVTDAMAWTSQETDEIAAKYFHNSGEDSVYFPCLYACRKSECHHVYWKSKLVEMSIKRACFCVLQMSGKFQPLMAKSYELTN